MEITKNGNEIILPKIDYYSAMFHGFSVNDILKYIECESFVADIVSNGNFETITQACQIWAYLSIEHVKIMFHYSDVIDYIEFADLIEDSENNVIFDEEFFNRKLQTIKIDISGQGLDFLRTKYENVQHLDEILMNPIECKEDQSFNVTRVDYAYDLINYKYNFLDECISFINKNYGSGDRVCCVHLRAGTSYEIHNGNKQKTLYLGETRSPLLLRVYDKKLQYDVKDKKYDVQIQAEKVTSWIRIELQTRGQTSNNILFKNYDDFYLSILKFIYDRYSFRDISTDVRKEKVADFWNELWDWDKIPHIIQNLQSVHYKPTRKRIEVSMERSWQTILLYFAMYGIEGIQNLIKKWIYYCNSHEPDERLEFIRKNRKKSFYEKYLCLIENNHLPFLWFDKNEIKTKGV